MYEFVFIEYEQVFHFLSHADEFNGYFKLMGNGEHYASFGRSVQFGDGQGSHLCGGGKLPGLFQGVLSGRTVQYQEHFVGASGMTFLMTRLILLNSSIR